MTFICRLVVMNFSELKNLVEVAKIGSIRGAAETLHIAPSALSRQIANLEHRLGVILFDRHAEGMKLTSSGEVVIRHARLTLRGFERMRSELDDIQSMRQGHVKIATAEGAVADFIFNLIHEMRDVYPGITYEVMVKGSRLSLEALANDQCDFGIIFNPEPHPDVTVLQKNLHPIRAIAAPSHPYSRQKILRLDELAAGPLCLLTNDFALRAVYDQAMREENVESRPVIVINSIEFAKTFSRDGLGISIVPLFAVRRDMYEGTLYAIPIEHRLFENSTVAICIHKERMISIAAETVLKRTIKAFERFVDFS